MLDSNSQILFPVVSQIFKGTKNIEHTELVLIFSCYFSHVNHLVNCVIIQMKPNPYSRQTFNRNAVGVKDFPAIYQYECTEETSCDILYKQYNICKSMNNLKDF